MSFEFWVLSFELEKKILTAKYAKYAKGGPPGRKTVFNSIQFRVVVPFDALRLGTSRAPIPDRHKAKAETGTLQAPHPSPLPSAEREENENADEPGVLLFIDFHAGAGQVSGGGGAGSGAVG
jgi:hypothetical protein